MQHSKKSGADIAALLSRILLAIVIFPHGAQKLLGWFGGYGFQGTMQFFTQTVGLPWLVGLLVIIFEFFGPFFILSGLATRITAFFLSVQFIGIILTSHSHYFFMNWFGNQKGEGFEYFLLAIGLTLGLAIHGAGSFSLDQEIKKWQANKRRPQTGKKLQPAI